MKNQYITASEIGEYVYCKRAWWLKIQGLGTTNAAMISGQIAHTKLSEWLAAHKRNMFLAILLILASILLLLYSFFSILNPS